MTTAARAASSDDRTRSGYVIVFPKFSDGYNCRRLRVISWTPFIDPLVVGIARTWRSNLLLFGYPLVMDLVKHSRIWLDLLAPEICWQIAACVAGQFWEHENRSLGPSFSTSLLSLAETSPVQRDAVLWALSHKFELGWGRVIHADRWFRIFACKVQCVELCWKQQCCYGFVTEAVKFPSLRSLRIGDDRKLLLATQCAMPSLRRLHLELRREQHVPLVVKVLSDLSVSDLSLLCGTRTCYFNMMKRAGSTSLSLPCLLSLQLGCLKCNDLEDIALEWPIFGSTPSLRKLKLKRCELQVNPSAFSQLRNLESVEIERNVNALKLATLLGCSVTALLHPVNHPLDSIQISRLSSCPRLSEFNAFLSAGAEEALPTISSSLQSLWVLHSHCKPGIVWDWRPGLLPRIVLNAPHLSSLYIYSARMPLLEVLSVMRLLGSKLKEFGVSVVGQEEPAWKYLLRIMETAGECNTSLQELEVRAGRKWIGFGVEEAELLINSFLHLSKRAPRLDARSLAEFIATRQSEHRRCTALKDLARFVKEPYNLLASRRAFF